MDKNKVQWKQIWQLHHRIDETQYKKTVTVLKYKDYISITGFSLFIIH